MKLASLPLHIVRLPEQLHRADLDAQDLTDLAHSIATVGLLNPITVRALAEGYELVAGHRRYLACHQLGWTHIPATIMDGDSTSTDTAETARIVENLHRSNLTPIEEALPIQRMSEAQGLTVEQISKTVHRSPGWVTERLQLAQLDTELRVLVHSRQLSIGAALLLTQVTDASHRAHLMRYALQDGVSVPVLRDWIREWHQAKAASPDAPAALPVLSPIGQPVTITVPCFLCHAPTNYQRTSVVRLCADCVGEVATQAAEQQATTRARQ